jgi:hypothetical protein
MLTFRGLAGMVVIASFAGSVFELGAAELGPVPVTAPVGVSPGRLKGVAQATRCASFSWSRVDGAEAYELAVYRMEDGGAEPEPVLSEQIPGGATSFSPPADACPSRGERHAWAVRAITSHGPSVWSEPLFFEVERSLTDEELSLALEILRRRALDGIEETTAARAAGETSRGERAGANVEASFQQLRHARDAGEGGVLRAAPAPGIVPGVPAALRVAGEVRTVDTEDPDGLSRLWGKGRVAPDTVNGTPFLEFEFPCVHEGIRYGLSDVIVDWGSAADACPVGTWVCKESEISACDTVRMNSVVDGVACWGDPIDTPGDEQRGWLAGQGDFLFALYVTEGGTTNNEAACTSLPVWCCWD